ncbi:MAG: Serine phosphatase RsbU, regulator of sigma subunit [Herbinix sp.]|jgi:hypothetical protein|nr:Serine phosphatase RsbU, regulator of sigma subunit [Herbinix sp.]
MKVLSSKKRLFVLIFSICIAMLVLVGFFVASDDAAWQLSPKKGVLDLNNWNPEQGGVLSLGGEWEFYWERFLTMREVEVDDLIPDVTPNVPQVWNKAVKAMQQAGIMMREHRTCLTLKQR